MQKLDFVDKTTETQVHTLLTKQFALRYNVKKWKRKVIEIRNTLIGGALDQ